MKRLLLSAAVAAAALAPVPAQAAGAKPCEAGYRGVVVYDDDGDVARLCVRDPGVDPREVLDPLLDYPGELVGWVRDEVPPRCVYYPDPGVIECDLMRPPPTPLR